MPSTIESPDFWQSQSTVTSSRNGTTHADHRGSRVNPRLRYELCIVQTGARDSENRQVYVAQVMVGLSRATLLSLPDHSIPTYHFWESMARLEDHLRLVDTRARERGMLDSVQQGAVWSDWAPHVLHDSLHTARLTGMYHVHKDEASFYRTVEMQLNRDYRCGVQDEPIFSIFILSKEMSQVHAASPNLAYVNGFTRVPWTKSGVINEIVDAVVATVDDMRSKEVEATYHAPNLTPGDRFAKAIACLAVSSLMPNRFTELQWQTILRATEKGLPGATDLQAHSTEMLLRDLTVNCHPAGRVRYEVHSGKHLWDLYKAVERVVSV